ncbi:MAG TPA: hypothetical protein PKN48_12530 [Bacteroidales bacterium]|nr:hypothetical protein [Bacteroidales bacterium]
MSIAVLSGLYLLLSDLLIGFGLLLLILGIVQKKAGQWVPGILITIFALVFCIAGLIYLIDKSANNGNCDMSYNYEYSDTPYDRYEEDTDTAKTSDETDNYNEGYISGFIQDDDKSLVHIKLIPDPVLEDLGITAVKIDTYAAGGNKTIPLNLDFSKKFKGELQLILYSSDDEEIGKSLVQINQNENSAFTVKFLFDKNTNFLKTEYARLKSSY